MKLALAALFAVLAFSAMAASTASAAHPIFVNGPAKGAGQAELLFSGEGGLAILRALNVGVLGTIDCDKSLVHGFSVDLSTLAKKVVFSFHGKCLLTAGSTVAKCNEPITTELSTVELGLASSTLLKVLELVAPESGTKFVTVTCGSNITTTEGAVVGEIPELNSGGTSQYNAQRGSLETVFEAEGKNTDKQRFSSLFLLGVQMGGELKVEGFFGGKASQEGKATTKPDANGTVDICTWAAPRCP
jgi:hypothetical protein